MKRKIIAAVMVTVLTAAVILTGCSSQQNAPAATQAPAAAATEAPATAAPATEAPAATAAPAQQDNGTIDMEKAKTIALEDAGLAASDVNFTKTKLDTDDGVQKYEIEFTSNGYEYDYDINAQTGAIMEKGKEVVEPYDD